MHWDDVQRIEVGTVTLNVARAGAGRPLLLLHGFPDSHELWGGVAPRLVAAGRQLIAPDLRGFGASDAPSGRREYGIERLLGDLTGLLHRLGVQGPVDVIGHDWGAVLTWCLAMSRPGLLGSCIVVSVGHPREYALAGLEQKRKGMYTIGWQFPGLSEHWLERHDYARLRHWLRQHPDADGRVRELARPGRLTAGLNWYRANLLPAMLRSWPSCRVPTLGIWSSDDFCLAEDQMWRSSRRMAAAWRYERIERCGHWPMLEQPGRIAELAVQWFG